MKTILFLAVLAGLSCGILTNPVLTRSLKDDMRDFIDLIPMEKVEEIFTSNLDDPEVQAVIEFLFSDDFKALLLEIESIPEFQSILNYLQGAGLPVYTWLGELHSLVGLEPPHHSASSRSLKNVIQQIMDLLPLDKIKALYYEKLQNSAEFKELIEKLKSPTFKNFVETLKANQKIQDIISRLKTMGIDLSAFFKRIKDFLEMNN